MPSAGFNSIGGFMNIQIMIGGIRFRFDLNFEIKVEDALSPFLCIDKKETDVNIKVIYDKNIVVTPPEEKIGEDLLLEYYQEKGQLLCLAKGGTGKYLSSTVCDSSFEFLECCICINPAAFKTLGNILRFLPMCMILQQKNILFFHASQIETCGKGILFSAPSGTGKTTQAKLWKKYRNARIICNDRTLIRECSTYGYPVDGSEPVGSGEILPLGAVICLEQAESNEIRRLRPKEALQRLLPEMVICSWHPQMKVLAIEQLLLLMEKYPVYLFQCTKTESAVNCLETQLKEDGVIENAKY